MWSLVKQLVHRYVSRKTDRLSLAQVFEQFQTLLQNHQKAMELIADLAEKAGGDYVFDRKYLIDVVHDLQDELLRMVQGLNIISANRYWLLHEALDRIFMPLQAEVRGRLLLKEAPYVVSLRNIPLDTPELTGGKANTLAEISQKMSLPVPNGFVITSKAFRRFLEHNNLEERIHAHLEAWLSGKEELSRAAGQIRYGILAGIIPQDLAREIRSHTEERNTNWAVRSSAYGEDGELSFAGLHESFLNVPSDEVPEAYKKVLAGLYNQEALTYRVRTGVIGEETAMAVLCQETVRSLAAGVVQTVNLEEADSDAMAVYASFGLGRTVVDGQDSPDRYVVEKEPPHRIVTQDIPSKQQLIRAASGGGEEEVAVDPDLQDRPSVSRETIDTLVKWGLSLERYFKKPQEMEWAVDESGKCWILQSRRLVLAEPFDRSEKDICDSCALYEILIQDKGAVARTGVGSGRVFTVRGNEDMNKFPEGAVLVTQFTAPWLAQIVPKASAVITERGSAAGHLATIAREFRVPALVNVEGALAVLHDGMEITLDAYHRLVYAGQVSELIRYELLQSTVFEESPEFRLLRRLLKRIAPLHLIDPQSPEFTPDGCTSVHDLIRFIHEKAVQELMDLPTFLQRFKGARVRMLDSNVPIGLKILDLGGGLHPEATGDHVRAEDIQSLPLAALWSGICEPDVWSTEPVHVDFKGLMASLTRNWDALGEGNHLAGFNLAVIDTNYMNLHLRLGYHFTLIDARMLEEPQHNHIYFRFVGGVTDMTRRSRRAQVLAQILTEYHFNAVTKGDLVVARLLHLPREEISARLKILGALIGFTRQLDIQLRSDQDIPKYVREFVDRHGNFTHSLMPGGANECKQASNHGAGR